MAVLLVATTLVATVSTVFAVQWILFIMGVVCNAPESSQMILYIGLLFMAGHLCYTTATLAIYAQRIYILVFPLKSLKKVNRAIVLVEIIVAVIGISIAVVPNAMHAPMDVVPVPKGCYSMNCSHLVTRGNFSAGVSFALSICTVVLGCTFQYAHFKYRKARQFVKSETLKLHQFARYSFYIRLIVETLPYVSDIVLVNALGVRIGTYIGPYGVLGCSLDFCTCTVLYYKLVVMRVAKPKAEKSSKVGIISLVNVGNDL
uniref:G protein-coupled receptor n=1 Tax=Steinernema glaseri TaxID=37863 RepID=A0A1I7XXH9_9BILA